MTDDRLPRRLGDGTPTELGRPLVLDEDLARKIASLLRRGLTQEDMIRASGIARSTFYAWLDRARDLAVRILDPEDELTDETATVEELRLLDFLDSVTGARALAKSDALGAIRAAMPSDWRAAAWFLERSFPEEFGRRDHLTVQGDEVEIELVWSDDVGPLEDDIVDAELVEDGDDEIPEEADLAEDSEETL